MTEQPFELQPDATYLITGGVGGVGLTIARWMVGAGARHLVLVGRGSLREDTAQALALLESAGAQVSYLRGDVACVDDVSTMFATLADQLPPLRGIVHAAGVLADATLLQQSSAGLHAVFAPKVGGAWNLVHATRGMPLDFLVLFSSVSALLGTPGQSNYAAANAVLDAMAHSLRAEGIPATTIGWGRWADVGLAATVDRGGSLDRLGIAPMPPEAGSVAFGRVLAAHVPHLAVLDIDWSVYLSRDAQPPARFAEMVFDAGPSSIESSGTGAAGFQAQLVDAAPTERDELLLEHVRATAAVVMRFDDLTRVLPGQGFFQIGMDSLTAVELKNRLQNSLGLILPATMAFDYPTPATLARHLLDELFPAVSEPAAAEDIGLDLNGLPELSPDELRGLLDAELQAIDEELVR